MVDNGTIDAYAFDVVMTGDDDLSTSKQISSQLTYFSQSKRKILNKQNGAFLNLAPSSILRSCSALYSMMQLAIGIAFVFRFWQLHPPKFTILCRRTDRWMDVIYDLFSASRFQLALLAALFVRLFNSTQLNLAKLFLCVGTVYFLNIFH
ncbi:hypothetical protein T08_2392 [Trichinella sp. T8]|nr:hypothetical protein T08_2392 [Trichinella sp. T8]